MFLFPVSATACTCGCRSTCSGSCSTTGSAPGCLSLGSFSRAEAPGACASRPHLSLRQATCRARTTPAACWALLRSAFSATGGCVGGVGCLTACVAAGSQCRAALTRHLSRGPHSYFGGRKIHVSQVRWVERIAWLVPTRAHAHALTCFIILRLTFRLRPFRSWRWRRARAFWFSFTSSVARACLRTSSFSFSSVCAHDRGRGAHAWPRCETDELPFFSPLFSGATSGGTDVILSTSVAIDVGIEAGTRQGCGVYVASTRR